MNYWHAEVGNLAECAEPLFRMIRELTEQGREVAREHYGAGGWFPPEHRPLAGGRAMDGPDWGTFTAAAPGCARSLGALSFQRRPRFLREAYPLMKGAVEFFLDFLVEHRNTAGWSPPSTSPENFPARPGTTLFMMNLAWDDPRTDDLRGSTIDMQILSDLSAMWRRRRRSWRVDEESDKALLEKRGLLAPVPVGKAGDLQEWLEDWGQKEKSHRATSDL